MGSDQGHQRYLEPETDAQSARLEHFADLLERMFRHSGLHQRSSVQHAVLLASILKAQQTARGVQALAEAGCIEEIEALSRTLVEMTVNAAYLQRAGYDEVQRFIHFQPQGVYQQMRMLSDGRSGIAAGVLDRIRGLMTTRSADRFREHGDPTWSERTLTERAAASDAASQVPVMRLLVERIYPRGHAAAHGTYESLQPFIAALNKDGNRPAPDRQAAKVEALFCVNLCLFTLSLYLNQLFGLRMDRAIEDAAQANHPLSQLRAEREFDEAEYAPRPIRGRVAYG